LTLAKDSVSPREHDVSGLIADDMRILGDASGAEIARPVIGLGGSVGGEVGGEEGMEAGGRVIGDLAQADTAETKVASTSAAPTTSNSP
jgi:hypothetical protein